MDGRRFRLWVWSGLFAGGAVGCASKPKPFDATIPLPPQHAGFAQKSAFAPPAALPPAAETAVRPGKPGDPAKPETEVAVADLRLDEAMNEQQTTANREQLLDKARQGYQRALARDPKNKAALLGLARYYGRVGEKERCDEGFRKYLSAYPKDHEVAHEVAMTHAQWKDWAGAAQWCQFAIAADPENRGYHKTLGFCLARGGQWEPAFGALMKVMPEPQARFEMAKVLTHVGQAEAGKQQLALAMQADPNFAPARELLAEWQAAPRGVENPAGQVRTVEYQQEPSR